ncbi:putative membrane protein [[Clostridium] bifermentans ATCC 638]|uniref:Putative membrane protein n=1 Tax=Paraclostridium bifermentans ATCC 638 = DSM 14991 TaxID=1233171 RepID=T4VS68_PARBF|nr:hypothetical protein [Paraclostridium bifermentans]EQK43532.1 putative membrane protein [[Clostridium] bifermentans ATCC 638] [Paraclostridium bifermentans ATCC 638 = DSM 14991]RIZ59756.1 hypothetical protein CHH45_06540 [Paraclostridium bifermentans]UAG17381.1 hypothetical protein KXZ80_11390 [Paraclostridium bifermentans]
MNRILTLYNIEFKRIYKLYFLLIGTLFIANLAGVMKTLYDSVKRISLENNLPMNIDILKTNLGYSFINEFTKNDIYVYGSMALGVAILFCLLYATIIWYRDYYSKSKTIYTLLSLPQPRFNIYLAKLIMVIVMIYGAIACQFLFWYIDLNIIKILAGISSPNFANVYSNMMQSVNQINVVSAYLLDFLMIDLFGVILAVVVIFTGVLIERSFKKVGVLLGVGYILITIIGYVFIIGLDSGILGNLLLNHIMYYIVLLMVSILISYRLINKRVCV